MTSLLWSYFWEFGEIFLRLDKKKARGSEPQIPPPTNGQTSATYIHHGPKSGTRLGEEKGGGNYTSHDENVIAECTTRILLCKLIGAGQPYPSKSSQFAPCPMREIGKGYPGKNKNKNN